MNRSFLVSSLIIPAFALSLMGAAFPDPPSGTAAPASPKKAVAVLAGGCFWGMQGIFEHVKGVTDTTVGYSGGEKKDANYESVSDHKTAHAESIQITYDPSVISYGQLLKIYFSAAHDPTELNKQHNDVGPQYRSEIFYSNDEQKQIAEAYIKKLNDAKQFRRPVVTKVEALKAFYAAEAYHQHYLDLNPDQPYIAEVDLPLLANFKRMYPEMYKK